MPSTKKVSLPKIRWVIFILLLLFVNFYQLPYYYTMPGDAKVLNEIIQVDGKTEEEGTFMLTTVRMGKANLVNYVWARLSDSRELIDEKRIRRNEETDEEYHHRQLMMMSSSQDLATIVAYKKADQKAYYNNYGVVVTGIIDDMPASSVLELGDLIVSVDGTDINTAEDLLEELKDKKKNDEVKLKIIREKNEKDIVLSLTSFPTEIDPTGEKFGIGITNPMTKRELKVNPSITIDTEDIGGPSAGLMFSLEIYNQLVESDITKGYQIAGTGSINEEGEVGPIGGIKQKVIAAHRVGADIFFAPNEFNAHDSNYIDALEAANSINTPMEVVPVDTFEEALAYLEGLDPK